MSTGILGCVWGLGNVIIIKEPTFLKFELTAESFKRFKGGGAPRGRPGATLWPPFWGMDGVWTCMDGVWKGYGRAPGVPRGGYGRA